MLLVSLTQINDVCLRALPSNVRLFFLNKKKIKFAHSKATVEPMHPLKPAGVAPIVSHRGHEHFGVIYLRLRCRTGSLAAG